MAYRIWWWSDISSIGREHTKAQESAPAAENVGLTSEESKSWTGIILYLPRDSPELAKVIEDEHAEDT
ncbi:MAG: hypothetical protein HRF40_03825 [Nitrososphaera sp.]